MAQYTIKGLEEFLKNIDYMEKNVQWQVKERLEKEGKQIISAYRKRVRANRNKSYHKRQHLHNGMKATEPKKGIAGRYEVDIANDYKKAPHYHLVEHGHAFVKPYARKNRKKASKGRVWKTTRTRVDGKFYFDQTMDEMKPKILASRERWARDMVRKYNK